jgi:arabinogalactan endo-1,4-beta-galactosidase
MGMLGIVMTASLASAAEPYSGKPFLLGVDANYSLTMEEKGSRWKWPEPNDGDAAQDLFGGMQAAGVQALRVRIWTGEEGANGRAYATRVMQRAQAAGLKAYLVIFLSEDWADLEKQPAPVIWRSLSLEARLAAVREYSRATAEHFRQSGWTGHLYEIGNEIDFGICGIYPRQEFEKSPEELRRKYWPDAARIIRASQEGVLSVDPEAKFMLHIAHWWDAPFCTAFFEFMISQGARVDFAGLSYFPSSAIGDSRTFEQLRTVIDAIAAKIQRPVIIAECGYPSTPNFSGQFAAWRQEAPGYPLTPEGQQRWLEDFAKFCSEHPQIAGLFYWSPEWFGEGMWKAFALFDENGDAKPAWRAFRAP